MISEIKQILDFLKLRTKSESMQSETLTLPNVMKLIDAAHKQGYKDAVSDMEIFIDAKEQKTNSDTEVSG